MKNERYWFITADLGNGGCLNLGYTSDLNNPLNNKNIKKAILKNNSNLTDKQIVISNFIEFDNEKEFIEFWS